MNELFALIDCDNFYVSCERVFDPKLRDIPVVVLSNNDGCAISRSNEAKALGIKMGSPYFQIKTFLARHNGVALSSNYELYGNMSNRVMNVVRQFSADVEVYSIDEAFAKLCYKDESELIFICANIVSTIKKWTGIPVKVGVSTTKTLAKVASEQVKKKKIASKYAILSHRDSIETALKDTAVGDVWGIGRATAKKLLPMGVDTAYKLSLMNESDIKRMFSVTTLSTVMELKGISCINLETEAQDRKSLCVSRSFGKIVMSLDELRESVASYASVASSKLRKENLKANAVTVLITTSRFESDEKCYSNSFTIPFNTATSSTQVIIETALKALGKLYIEGYRYKKTGVILTDLTNEKLVQEDLFDFSVKKPNDKLSAVMDDINKKYGKGSIRYAIEGKNHEWEARREHLSKNYTSDWDEIVKVD